MKHKSYGFTLVEVLIVIVVLAILATIVTLGTFRVLESSRDSQRSASASVISEALEKYYIQNGRYPSCSALQGSASTVKDVLGVDQAILKAPSNDAANSISCSDITASTATDTYAYLGDGTSQCNSGGGCATFTLKYKSETSGEIQSIQSRQTAFSPTTGAITLSQGAVTSTSAALTWNPVIDAAEYEIQRATNASFTSNLVTSVYPTPNRTVTGLTMGVTYHFRIRAVDQYTNTIGLSNAISVTTPVPTPTGLAVTTNSLSQITANWNAVPRASSYRLQYSTSSSFSSPTTLTDITSTSRAVTGLTEATVYYFRVYAVANSTVSPASASVNTRTAVRAPTGVTATTNSATQVTVAWNAVTNAASYRVEYSTASNFSDSTTISNITTRSRAVKGLDEATLYYFRVYAVAGNTVSLPSSSVYTRTAVRAPTGVSATINSTSQVTVAWGAVTNAASYKVEYSTASNFSNSTTTSSSSSRSRAITGLSPATVYYFRVYAIAGSTTSLPSRSVNTRTGIGAPSGLSATTSSNTAIATSWNAVSGATSYRLEYSTASNFSGSTTATTTSTSRSVGSLSQGERYYFRVYAIVSGTVSNASGSANATTTIGTPSVPTLSNSSTSKKTTWTLGTVSCPTGTSVQYRYRYQLEDNSPNSWTNATTKPSPVYTTSSQGWNYKVQAAARCKTDHTSSSWSSERTSAYLRPVAKPGATTFDGWRVDWNSIRLSAASSCGSGATLLSRFDMYTYDWQWTPYPPNYYGWYRSSHSGNWVSGNEFKSWGNSITTGSDSGSPQGIPDNTRWKMVFQKKCQNITTGRASSTFSNESPVYKL